MGEAGYKVVAVMFFGKKEVARFPTREQAEWRAKELNETLRETRAGTSSTSYNPWKSDLSMGETSASAMAVLL